MDETLRQRIVGLMDAPDAKGCRRWLGRVDQYGVPVVAYRRDMSARRALWELERGPVARELIVIPSACGDTLCLNLAHATLSTRSRAATYRPTRPFRENGLKVVCVRGHPLSGANLRILPDGRRECVVCKNQAGRQWEQANPEKRRANLDKYKARKRERYRDDPEYRANHRAYDKAYYAAHREEQNAYKRAWRAANRDAINARRRARHVATTAAD